jgi:hypothetical protein
VTSRQVILALAFLLWATLTGLTLYVLFTEGPDVIVFVALVLVGTMGIGIFGALSERRGGPR